MEMGSKWCKVERTGTRELCEGSFWTVRYEMSNCAALARVRQGLESMSVVKYRSSGRLMHRRGRDRVRIGQARRRARGLHECTKKIFAPGFDRVFADHAEHRRMPLTPFLDRHGERVGKGYCQHFRIEGVDEQGRLEFGGGAGEPRQDQNARVLGVLSGDILFGDKIHPVAQWRDQAGAR